MPAVGIVGIGPMGANLARNFVRRGYHVVAYNRSVGRVAELAAKLPGHVTAAESYRDLAATLPRPRKVVVLVDTRATGAVLGDLARWLEPGDVVMEGGNASHTDTVGRQRELRSAGLHLLDVGVASGVDGALDGISATVGGDEAAFASVAADLAAVGTTVNGRSCCVRVGGDGTGHFVKMVHNGVEYTFMQLLAELVDVLRAATDLPPSALGEAFDRWNAEDFRSYVLQVAVDVLRHVDTVTGLPFVDVVDDRAVQNGSGSRAGRSALALATPATLFAESSFARALSADTGMRQAWGIRTASSPGGIDLLPAGKSAFQAALLVTYAQAFRHIHAANHEYGWNADLTEVAHSWCGATIRSAPLHRIASSAPDSGMSLLPADPEVRAELTAAEPGLRRVVEVAVATGVATPCLSAALAYLDGMRADRSSGAVVQALRSRLGGSVYRRTDRDGAFVLDWDTKAERLAGLQHFTQ